MPRNDTATAPPEVRFLDMFDVLTPSRSEVVFRRGYWDLGQAGGNDASSLQLASLFGAVSFGAPTITPFAGGAWWTTSSLPATTNGRQSNITWPIGADYSLDPAVANRPLRYLWEVVMRRATPIVAGTGFGMGFRTSNTLLALNTQAGIAVESITTLNGARWTVNRRLVAGGANIPVDTLIPGETPVLVQFIYDDGTAPRLQVLVNGVTFLDITALGTAIPQIPDGSGLNFFPQWVGGDATLGGAGQVDRLRRARMTVEQRPGFA